jgi:hypothetical protein
MGLKVAAVRPLIFGWRSFSTSASGAGSLAPSALIAKPLTVLDRSATRRRSPQAIGEVPQRPCIGSLSEDLKPEKTSARDVVQEMHPSFDSQHGFQLANTSPRPA